MADSFIQPITIPNAGAAVASTAYQLTRHTRPYVPVSILVPDNLRGVSTVKIQVTNDPLGGASTFVDIAPVTPIPLTVSTEAIIPEHVRLGILGRPWVRLVSDANPSADLTLNLSFLPAEDVHGGGALASQAGAPATVAATLNGTSPEIAAAGDYAAGDVLNDSASAGHAWVIPNAARAAGRGGIIEKVLVTCDVEGMIPRFRLHMFNALPGNLNNDNVALVLNEDERDNYLGFIDMPPLQTTGSSQFSWSQLIDRFPFKCPAGVTDLWFILQTLDAFTNEVAGMIVDVSFVIAQD